MALGNCAGFALQPSRAISADILHFPARVLVRERQRSWNEQQLCSRAGSCRSTRPTSIPSFPGCKRAVVGMDMIIGRSLAPLNSSRTMESGGASSDVTTTRARKQNIRTDSSACPQGFGPVVPENLIIAEPPRSQHHGMNRAPLRSDGVFGRHSCYL